MNRSKQLVLRSQALVVTVDTHIDGCHNRLLVNLDIEVGGTSHHSFCDGRHPMAIWSEFRRWRVDGLVGHMYSDG